MMAPWRQDSDADSQKLALQKVYGIVVYMKQPRAASNFGLLPVSQMAPPRIKLAPSFAACGRRATELAVDHEIKLLPLAVVAHLAGATMAT